MIHIIEKILKFDDHRSSEKNRAISTTTLIGANWKAQRDLLKDITPKASEDVDAKYRRSSTIGTGYHMRAEQALRTDPMVNNMEVYGERYVPEYDVWISGTYDLLYNNHLMDHKTGYGAAFPPEKQEKAAEQMSIYRWINEDEFIKSEAYILFVSQNLNAFDSYSVELSDNWDTDKFIKMRLQKIIDQKYIDCHEGVKYNPCTYCQYNEADCKALEQSTQGSF